MHPLNAGTGVKTPVTLERPNTIGLRESELFQFLDAMDHPAAARRTARDFVRWPFRKTTVRIQIEPHRAGGAVLSMACRNISRGGVSLLHNRYLHPGTPVALALPRAGGGYRPARGRIVRCAHRSGVIHEIGVAFETPINVRDLISQESLPDFLGLERIDPESLRGSVLCIAPEDPDTRIIRHFLRITQVSVRAASSLAKAAALLAERLDAVIYDADGGSETPHSVCRALRAAGCSAPLIVLSSRPDDHSLRAVPAASILSKPLSQDRLLRAVGECLLSGTAGAPREAPDAKAALLPALGPWVRALETAAARADIPGCRAVCVEIVARAGSAGMTPLAATADAAARALAARPTPDELRRHSAFMIAACRRVASQTPA